MPVEAPYVRHVRTGNVDGITGLHLHPPGAPASLVNISTTGLLAESTVKLRVGTPLRVDIDGGFTPAAINGRVVRCEVASMEHDGVLRYHIGIEFDVPLPAGVVRAAPAPPPAAAAKSVRNRW